MTLRALISLFLLSLFSYGCGGEPDYQYQTIVVDSTYSDWSDERTLAVEKAESEFAAFAKHECRRAISNGWSLHRVINEGTMNCERTSEGHHCRKKNAEIECRQVSEFFP
jgi:hypothetical protein